MSGSEVVENGNSRHEVSDPKLYEAAVTAVRLATRMEYLTSEEWEARRNQARKALEALPSDADRLRALIEVLHLQISLDSGSNPGTTDPGVSSATQQPLTRQGGVQ